MVTHSTHCPRRFAQTGALFEQLPLLMQATHVLRSGSQMGLSLPAQSESATHATHAPLAGSHSVPISQVTVLPLPQATWQV